MANKEIESAATSFLEIHAPQGDRLRSSRLVVMLGLLEGVRSDRRLDLSVHLTPNMQQLIDHDAKCKAGLLRFGAESPVSAFGRRSSHVASWGEPLFAVLRSLGFESADNDAQLQLLDRIGPVVADEIGTINQSKPLVARYRSGTAVAVIRDILDQAQQKNRAKDVAEYLVGAKLQLRFGDDAAKPKNVNTPNRGMPADFRVGNAAFEVTINAPDPRHLEQVQRILRDTGYEIWLLVRQDDAEKWRNTIDGALEKSQRKRVVVTDLETFLGQNVSEIARWETDSVKSTLESLFARYNEHWLPAVGGNAIRIVDAE